LTQELDVEVLENRDTFAGQRGMIEWFRSGFSLEKSWHDAEVT